MDIEASARKHGVTDDHMLHALRHHWRAFEITTRVEVLNPSGVTRVWVPLPLTQDTDYHKTLGRTWNGNATKAQAVRDPRYGAGFVVAEWPAGTTGPTLEVVLTESLMHLRRTFRPELGLALIDLKRGR